MKKIFVIFLLLFLVFPQSATLGQDQKICYLETIFSTEQIQVSSILCTKLEKPDGSRVELKLDIFYPMEDEAIQRPLLVWIHGGGFVGGIQKEYGKRCYEFAFSWLCYMYHQLSAYEGFVLSFCQWTQ